MGNKEVFKAPADGTYKNHRTLLKLRNVWKRKLLVRYRE